MTAAEVQREIGERLDLLREVVSIRKGLSGLEECHGAIPIIVDAQLRQRTLETRILEDLRLMLGDEIIALLAATGPATIH